MSNYQRKDGDGVLFKNDRKDSERHPDYKGQILINGREYWLSAWIKDGAKGKFMSMSAQPKDANGRQQDQRRSAPSSAPAPRQDDANYWGDEPF